MNAIKLSRNLATQISAHQKVEQQVVVLVKTAEATHTEHRKAKLAYKVAKKTARSAKLAWHRARILASEGQSMLKKSTKRLAKLRSQRSQSPSKRRTANPIKAAAAAEALVAGSGTAEKVTSSKRQGPAPL